MPKLLHQIATAVFPRLCPNQAPRYVNGAEPATFLERGASMQLLSLSVQDERRDALRRWHSLVSNALRRFWPDMQHILQMDRIGLCGRCDTDQDVAHSHTAPFRSAELSKTATRVATGPSRDRITSQAYRCLSMASACVDELYWPSQFPSCRLRRRCTRTATQRS